MKARAEKLKRMLENGSVTEGDIKASYFVYPPMELNQRIEINPCAMDLKNLKLYYELCCEEYRRRLCEMWDFNFEDSWWPGEHIGEELCVGDWVVLDMPQVKYCVENQVSYDAFCEYWQFVLDEAHNGKDHPRINFYHWMKGLRPEMLKDDDT